MNAGQFRLMVLGAALAVGFGGAADAKSRGGAGHAAAPAYASSAHARGGSHFAMPASFGRHGTAIAFETGRFGRAHFASRNIGGFGFGGGHARYAYGYGSGHSGGGIQCVTFARADSGIELSGNANTWWDNAAGVYQRGSRPEAGSVLNFRANSSMRMGHVAVVNQVVDSRTIEIDHANWGGPGAVRGGISRDISVIDVSPTNDWSAVRVALGHSGDYGSIYPTFGFIYNRPDRGMMIASNAAPAPMPAVNPAPRDLRPAVRDVSYDEVAEAPDSADDMPVARRGRGRASHSRHSLVMPVAYHPGHAAPRAGRASAATPHGSGHHHRRA